MRTPPKSIHHRRRTDLAADYSCSNPCTTIVPEMGLAAMELTEILAYYTQANHKLRPALPKQLTKERKIFLTSTSGTATYCYRTMRIIDTIGTSEWNITSRRHSTSSDHPNTSTGSTLLHIFKSLTRIVKTIQTHKFFLHGENFLGVVNFSSK